MSLSFLQELTKKRYRIFTAKEAHAIGKNLKLKTSYIPRLLYLLTQKKVLRSLMIGRYALADDFLSGSPISPYEIAMHLAHQGAIGYWSAMIEHGLSDQNLTTTFILKPYENSTTFPRTHNFTIENHLYRVIPTKEEDFWGIEQRFFNEIPFQVTNLERTLLDGLRLPQYCGGFQEVLFGFEQAVSRLQKDVLLDYAKLCSIVTQKRLGWILEKLSRFPELQEQLHPKNSNTYDRLDPQGERRGSQNLRWKLIENI